MEQSGPRSRTGPNRAGPARERGVQTDSRGQGQAPRLSKGNLFTLLSLWMEIFPQDQTEDEQQQQQQQQQINPVGLVVVKDGKVVGLHSSGSELHAGQAAILEHGAKLSQSSLYFSRRPCATCLKMIINAGVSEICFWPGDPEVSMLRAQPSENYTSHDASVLRISEEAALDALASDKLKSNSRAHICVPLQPLAPGLAQFVTETSRNGDFMEKIAEDEPEVDLEQLYNRERLRALASLSSRFLVGSSEEHQELLSLMSLENFRVEPYFCGLRHNMEQLLQVLSAVIAEVPRYKDYGFYRSSSDAPLQSQSGLDPGLDPGPVSAEVAVHCMVQARLLSYRTEDPKVGVGSVIWAKRKHSGLGPALMGGLYLVGCGFNAYPSGSHFNEFPQMDDKQEDRQRRKYRYIIHAEQNALTFRSGDLGSCAASLLFVTKCPCDECVPLIRAAGISHIYSSDLDQGRDKGDISYRSYKHLHHIHKHSWRRSPDRHSSSHYINGFLGKHSLQMEPELRNSKKLCTRTPDSNGE